MRPPLLLLRLPLSLRFAADGSRLSIHPRPLGDSNVDLEASPISNNGCDFAGRTHAPSQRQRRSDSVSSPRAALEAAKVPDFGDGVTARAQVQASSILTDPTRSKNVRVISFLVTWHHEFVLLGQVFGSQPYRRIARR